MRAQRNRRGALEIDALSPVGAEITVRVRTCWTWAGLPSSEQRISGAQLLVVPDGDWKTSFQRQARAWSEAGVTHALVVQGSEEGIELAALIALADLYSVWEEQRLVCAREIEAGTMGRMTRNFVENGDSPTLWLKDEREAGGAAVVRSLWENQAVFRLDPRASIAHDWGRNTEQNDTYDDLAQPDYANIGSDDAGRRYGARSYVPTDARVRAEVIKRAVNGCERQGCEDERKYAGFLDVHHILGAARSDRVWNCVALCPNCHRAAHYAPDREDFNAKLLVYALQFAPEGMTFPASVAEDGAEATVQPEKLLLGARP